MPHRIDIVEKARSFIGVPWRHQGRTRIGIDCAGLVVLTGKELGLTEYDSTDYQRHSLGPKFLGIFREALIEKNVDDAKPGDILLFRDKQFPCHSAIVGNRKDRLTIIHASAQLRKVVEEELEQGDWQARRVACFSFPGVEE